MNADLERLIQLQQVEDAIKRVEAALGAIPKRREERDAELSRARGALDGARGALDTLQKNRRQRESSLQDFEGKRSKYKSQLMDVKTNKEYTAMLHEIETVEREIRSIEDLILTDMEAAETLAAQAKREEGIFREAETEHRAAIQGLDAEQREREAERVKLVAQRDQVAVTVSEDALQLFRRVARLRGSGVAEAKDCRCQLCHVVLRLQMYADLKKSETLMQCPSCSRVLYYQPPVPVVEPPL
jgi:uncharacterized protein